MGDTVLRTSLLVQRGFICQACGAGLPEEAEGRPRTCRSCTTLLKQPTNSSSAAKLDSGNGEFTSDAVH